MRPVLRSTLNARIRRRTNMENSQFVQDTELNEMIDEAASWLYDLLIMYRGQEYYASNYVFNTANGIALYAMPADFYQVLSVDMKISGLWGHLRHYAFPELPGLLNASASYYPSDYYYRLQGAQETFGTALVSQITILPIPTGAYPVQVSYIPTFAGYVNAGDVRYDGINGWEDAIVWRCVAQCLAKEESDPSFAMAMLASAEARIKDLAGARDAGNAERVIDARSDSSTLGPSPRWLY